MVQELSLAFSVSSRSGWLCCSRFGMELRTARLGCAVSPTGVVENGGGARGSAVTLDGLAGIRTNNKAMIVRIRITQLPKRIPPPHIIYKLDDTYLLDDVEVWI